MFDRQDVQRAVSEEVFRQLPVAMVIVEAPSGKVLYVNRQTQQMTQATGEEVAVRSFRIDVPEEDLVDLRRRIAATRWPDRKTVPDRSQELNALPQFML